MKLVLDATPLIYLSKVKILEKLPAISSQLIIPFEVFTEVITQGKKRGDEEAFYIEELVNRGLFTIEKTKNKDDFPHPVLSIADRQVIELTRQSNRVAIIDDQHCRDLARMVNVRFTGSVGLLFILVGKKIITKEECKIVLDDMIKKGWYCSTVFYTQILNKLNEL